MEWTEVNIYTTTEGIELVCSKLTDIGVKGFAIRDAEDFKEFLENKNGQWDYIDKDLLGLTDCETCITVYIPSNDQGAEMLTAIKSMLSEMRANDTEKLYGRLEAELTSIREEDWANNWKQYFKPFKVGEKLFVKPTWEEAETPDGRKTLLIDPESSFGTGQHHTTRLCLELLESALKEGDRVLDMGCGSGILSIAASILGANEVTAVDIEENAVKIATKNAKKNNISLDNYTLYCGNILDDESLVEKIEKDGCYDLILANIVADVLKAMAPLFNKFLRKGGTLIVSGIITEREKEVLDAIIENGFELSIANEKEGWAAAKLIKK